jgi:glycerophosphoryl diester phosphodiesterase
VIFLEYFNKTGATKMKTAKQWLIGFVVALLILILVNLGLATFCTPKLQTVFPELPRPIQIAHQGGESLAPSNTMTAFDLAHALRVPVLDLDLHMTKDGHLVAIHDPTINRTTNGTGAVYSYSLKDLKKLDAGYTFVDLKGNHSYRGLGVTIPTLDEIFQTYGQDSYFNIEIKDDNPSKQIPQIEQKLWFLIQKYHLQKKVIINSFDDGIIHSFKQLSHGQVAVGASRAEVTRFVILTKLHLTGFYRPQASVLEIPTENSGINLKDRHLIETAHRFNMQVYYWTIDDKKTMKELLQLGADGILTNRPDLLKEVVEEEKKK